MISSAVRLVALVVLLGSLAFIGWMVVYEDAAEERTSGKLPWLFYRGLDNDLTDEYRGVLGIAHNSGDSAQATRLALRHGTDVIEIDVVEIGGRLYAGHSFPLPWLGQRTFRGPTLEEAWDASSEARATKLDLKSSAGSFVRRVTSFLATRRDDRTVMVAAGGAAALSQIRDEAPWVVRLYSIGSQPTLDGFIADEELQSLADGVTMRYTLYDEEVVAWFREQGLLSVAWTVNDVDDFNRLTAWGINAITTDNLAFLEVMEGDVDSWRTDGNNGGSP